MEYNKLLKTRNEYLKILFSNSIADKTYLDEILLKDDPNIILDEDIAKDYFMNAQEKEYDFFATQKDLLARSDCHHDSQEAATKTAGCAAGTASDCRPISFHDNSPFMNT